MRLLAPLITWTALFVALAAPARAIPPTLKAISDAFAAGEHRRVVQLTVDLSEDPKARYLAGESRLVLGEPVEAESDFRFVLSKNAKALPALVGLGRSLSLQAKHEEALTTLKSAAALDAKDVPAQRALGEALLASGETKEGTAVLEGALKLGPHDPLTVRALVEARLKAEEWKGAKELAQRLQKAQPKSPLGDFLLALTLDREGEADQAIEAYEKALAKDDAFLDAHKNLAILCHARSDTYQNVERVKKAFEHYERYFELGGADERLKKMFDILKQFAPQIGIQTK